MFAPVVFRSFWDIRVKTSILVRVTHESRRCIQLVVRPTIELVKSLLLVISKLLLHRQAAGHARVEIVRVWMSALLSRLYLENIEVKLRKPTLHKGQRPLLLRVCAGLLRQVVHGNLDFFSGSLQVQIGIGANILINRASWLLSASTRLVLRLEEGLVACLTLFSVCCVARLNVLDELLDWHVTEV